MYNYPLKYEVTYPEKSSRGLILARLFLGWFYIGIPHGIFGALYGIVAFFVGIYGWLMVLLNGSFPADAFGFLVKYERYMSRVRAYWTALADQYPPFSGEE
jgi:hypothetical protein